MLTRVDRSSLGEVLAGSYDCFVCCVGFEDRGLVVAGALDRQNLKAVYLLENQPGPTINEAHNQKLLQLFADVGSNHVVQIKIGQPLLTVDQVRTHVIPAIKNANKKTLIDITTFTHEHLLIVLYFLKLESLLGKVVFGYTGAQDYSVNTPLESLWLTKGVKQVRSVIGYPGELVPSRDLHLIVLVGFEHERAQKVIEAYEPARLSIGFAPRLRSVSEQLSDTNRAFFLRVQAFVKETRIGTTMLDEFEFSCIDPIQARDAILEQVQRVDGYNTVICPLNTKIATIGAALAAFKRGDAQLCYVEPAVYNTVNYSSAGRTVTLFDIPIDA